MLQNQFETIIVGLDFSPTSKAAIHQALILQKMTNSKLVLVHVGSLPDITLNTMSSKDIQQLVNSIGTQMEKYYKIPAEIDFRSVISFGNPAEQIISTAKDYPSPLIVIGRSGYNAIGRFFLGSTAEQLSATSPFPVWIQEGRIARRPRKAVIAVDLKSGSKKLLNWAKSFSDKYQTTMDAVYVSQPFVSPFYGDYLGQVDGILDEVENLNFLKLTKSVPNIPVGNRVGDPATEIGKAAKRADLIIVSHHIRQKNFLNFGSVSAKVVRNSRKPVLVMPQ